MTTQATDLDALVAQKYRHGFVTDIESDTVPRGLAKRMPFIALTSSSPLPLPPVFFTAS